MDKTRKLETVGIRSIIACSHMEAESLSCRTSTLANANPIDLSKLSEVAFITAIVKLYS